ncbi:unnamed protein product [marine sediment metagenome]|uniref:Uncharacterized protein n=1 Tax=marine sediment metagenome TaxID=412755 RepID=X0WBQ3_9ZZZZ
MDEWNRDAEGLKMTFPVLVEPCEGRFVATLVGAPEVRVVAPTRDEALAALRNQITRRVAQGELSSVEVAAGGISDFAGRYADDPVIRQICSEVYEQRDAEAHG